MAFAGVVGKVRFVVVMIETGYGEPDQRAIRILRAKRKISSRFSVKNVRNLIAAVAFTGAKGYICLFLFQLLGRNL
jgi:nitrate reductase NapE component